MCFMLHVAFEMDSEHPAFEEVEGAFQVGFPGASKDGKASCWGTVRSPLWLGGIQK